MIKRILLPLTDTPAGYGAREHALLRARERGARLIALALIKRWLWAHSATTAGVNGCSARRPAPCLPKRTVLCCSPIEWDAAGGRCVRRFTPPINDINIDICIISIQK
ncbi:hypothetical protein [Crenobacter caeni]|uniref:Universal stress protein n=1 Tax=Crenobacter caeni TaxID=2705474 RepID=A0A6B2KS02_9NEIS|nr:hypothetical protein [Crenobacter caeni]NDV12938.1 hypothetical protein [Crenobacter caeni]